MRKKQILFYTIISLMFISNQSSGALNMSKEVSWKQNNDQGALSFGLIPLKTRSFFHDEVVATFTFEQYSSELLLLTATIEKNHFIHAIKTGADCNPKDMMKVCGNQSLVDNFSVIINDQRVFLKQESLSIQKDVVVLTYSISIFNQTIKQINVTSNYLFDFNNHSILKVIFDLGRRARTFKLKNKRRTITARFK